MDDMVIKSGEDSGKIAVIAGALAEGKVIILPAATVYGISAVYDNTSALKRIYSIKNRDTGMPFIILISDTAQLEKLIKPPGHTGKVLIEKYWNPSGPLPLTMIFKKHDSLPAQVTGGRDTVAVRMAGLKAIRRIIDIAGPIVSTSANISGQGTVPSDIENIPSHIRSETDMTVRLSGGLAGRESTIVDVSSGKPVLVREGAVSFAGITGEFKKI